MPVITLLSSAGLIIAHNSATRDGCHCFSAAIHVFLPLSCRICILRMHGWWPTPHRLHQYPNCWQLSNLVIVNILYPLYVFLCQIRDFFRGSTFSKQMPLFRTNCWVRL